MMFFINNLIMFKKIYSFFPYLNLITFFLIGVSFVFTHEQVFDGKCQNTFLQKKI